MTCPVCKNKGISVLATNCPNCATNLIGLKMYHNLEEHYIDLKKEKIRIEGNLAQQKVQYEAILKKKKKRFNRQRWILLLLPIALFFFFNNYTIPALMSTRTSQQDSLLLIKTTLASRDSQLVELNHQLKTVKGTKVKKELKYVVKKGDTLNELAKLFYNDSTAWYQIALDNKVYDIRGLPVGDTIVLKYRE